MKKLTLLTLLIVLHHSYTAYGKLDIYGRRHYHIALHVNTPTGLMSKYGGGLEIRNGGLAVLYSYNKYMGAYPGFQMGMEWEVYLRTYKRHQSYIYAKGVLGESSYDGSKITMFGYPTDIQIGAQGYGGAGAGYGRRWNFKVFFVTFSTGLKYCVLDVLDNMPQKEKNLFTLFHYTGPGSYIDVHFQFGIQL